MRGTSAKESKQKASRHALTHRFGPVGHEVMVRPLPLSGVRQHSGCMTGASSEGQDHLVKSLWALFVTVLLRELSCLYLCIYIYGGPTYLSTAEVARPPCSLLKSNCLLWHPSGTTLTHPQSQGYHFLTA